MCGFLLIAYFTVIMHLQVLFNFLEVEKFPGIWEFPSARKSILPFLNFPALRNFFLCQKYLILKNSIFKNVRNNFEAQTKTKKEIQIINYFFSRRSHK